MVGPGNCVGANRPIEAPTGIGLTEARRDFSVSRRRRRSGEAGGLAALRLFHSTASALRIEERELEAGEPN